MHKAVLISYDLRQPDRDYEPLYKAIRGYAESSCHPLDSVWLVATPDDPADVARVLEVHMDEDDRLLVVPFQHPAGSGLELGDQMFMTIYAG